METASSRGVKDPVEAGCEDEEGEEMENFVIYYSVDLEGTKSGVCCRGYEEEEGSCIMSVRAAEGAKLMEFQTCER